MRPYGLSTAVSVEPSPKPQIRKHDHPGAGGRGLADQADGLGDAGIGIERDRARLDDRNTDTAGRGGHE